MSFMRWCDRWRRKCIIKLVVHFSPKKHTKLSFSNSTRVDRNPCCTPRALPLLNLISSEPYFSFQQGTYHTCKAFSVEILISTCDCLFKLHQRAVFIMPSKEVVFSYCSSVFVCSTKICIVLENAWKKYLNKIARAVADYVPCDPSDCSCHAR